MTKKERPSFDAIFMQMAKMVSLRSTCRRLAVGCVIASIDKRKILSIGYNGNATGLPNDCDSDTPGACGCLHGECNAVVNCDAPRAQEKIVYVTDLPCLNCAKILINLGNVLAVHYDRPYRKRDGEQALKAAGIPVIHSPIAEDVTGAALGSLCEALGWQGGTLANAIAEVEYLKKFRIGVLNGRRVSTKESESSE
jgi:dCMP deaminase